MPQIFALSLLSAVESSNWLISKTDKAPGKYAKVRRFIFQEMKSELEIIVSNSSYTFLIRTSHFWRVFFRDF